MSSTSSLPSKTVPSSSSSAPPPPTASSSSSGPPPSSSSPLQNIPTASFDNRSRAQQNFGSQSLPRKTQASRRQHRNQKRATGGTTSSANGGGSHHMDEEDAMAEIRALRNASSRRGQTSITHLMSYALPPRPHETHHHHASYSRSYRRNPSWGVGSGYHAVDKARYIHANYRFVVNPESDYSKQAADADQHLEWNDVLQVIASTESQQASCPICLGEPVAPRMAKCGHIFCLPCLMRFMGTNLDSQEEKGGTLVVKKHPKWRKCPICEDGIFLSDVKPVRFYAGQESPLPRPGDDVILRLMARNAKSTLALPRESGAEVLESGEDVPWHFAANVLDYARIMRGTGGYMAEQFEREVEDLRKQGEEDELLYHEDGEWTQKAVRSVETAKEKMVGLGEKELEIAAAAAAASNKGKPPEQPQQQPDFFFYTTPPHLYLSPLDIRILKTQFGSFSNFPSTLLPRVEHISTGNVVDDLLRRKAKYLGHLPYGCLISFLECDWTDIVEGEVLAQFGEEIEKRRKRNRDKAAQEERERIQAERIEAAQVRGARRQQYGSGGGILEEEITAVRYGNAWEETTVVNMDDFLPLGATGRGTGTGTSPPNERRGFGMLSEISTSPSGRRTVWGTPALAVSGGEEGGGENNVVRGQVDDGWLGDDVVLETLGATDLSLQLEALGVTDGDGGGGQSSAGASQGGVGGGGGKRKKKQKITLMSTGGRRGN
ncbi:hypothetical protein QBC38DRAFT_109190 [Podospora fimiseda]|uniref:RING-type domain-containing protein n=1 Tax=Podospora fimiseda TaxID=252190 RepID=A0AAN7BTZ4_9PEZI|nr:hypothetical protein QBC38DRAFT_109190 [Podospora fimiseda]